jgi:hypothetical protein
LVLNDCIVARAECPPFSRVGIDQGRPGAVQLALVEFEYSLEPMSSRLIHRAA